MQWWTVQVQRGVCERSPTRADLQHVPRGAMLATQHEQSRRDVSAMIAVGAEGRVWSTATWVALLLGATAGCAESRPFDLSVVDSQGLRLERDCSWSAYECPWRLADGEYPVDCGGRAPYLTLDGTRVVSVNTSCVREDRGVGPELMELRPVVCGADEECASDAVCERGICQRLERPVSRYDLFSLCLMDEPRWPDAATWRSEEAGFPALDALADAHCDGPDDCTIPAECYQP